MLCLTYIDSSVLLRLLHFINPGHLCAYVYIAVL